VHLREGLAGCRADDPVGALDQQAVEGDWRCLMPRCYDGLVTSRASWWRFLNSPDTTIDHIQPGTTPERPVVRAMPHPTSMNTQARHEVGRTMHHANHPATITGNPLLGRLTSSRDSQRPA
jgi:hypothetical protein